MKPVHMSDLQLGVQEHLLGEDQEAPLEVGTE